MKKLLIIPLLILCLMLATCQGKEKKEYGNEPGAGSGTIGLSENGFEIKLENIFAGRGADIDYLKNVKVADGCEVSVDSSAVNTNEPGDYTVIYTVTKGKDSESGSITLTIRDTKEPITDAEAETIKSGEVIGGDSVKYPVQDAQTASIELTSGKTVQIKCTTKRYIVSTETDSKNIKKGKKMYNVKTLRVVFNTGEEQVLETVQKKID